MAGQSRPATVVSAGKRSRRNGASNIAARQTAGEQVAPASDVSSELTIGTRLREARKAAGLTQVQASEKAGIRQAYISNLESDMNDPSLSTLQALARAYGMTVSELLEPLK